MCRDCVLRDDGKKLSSERESRDLGGGRYDAWACAWCRPPAQVPRLTLGMTDKSAAFAGSTSKLLRYDSPSLNSATTPTRSASNTQAPTRSRHRHRRSLRRRHAPARTRRVPEAGRNALAALRLADREEARYYHEHSTITPAYARSSRLERLRDPALPRCALTGNRGLIPDPYFGGGGLHQIESGGFLKIHTDFNVHPKLKLDRRVNMLVYLNHDWRDEWGGHLELWNAAMTERRQKIAPLFNRTVVFSTTDSSFHGHPHPLATPSGITRNLSRSTTTRGRPEDSVGAPRHDLS